MAEDIKPIVSFKESFEKLDIRVGKVIEVEFESSTHKPNYKMISGEATFVSPAVNAKIGSKLF